MERRKRAFSGKSDKAAAEKSEHRTLPEKKKKQFSRATLGTVKETSN